MKINLSTTRRTDMRVPDDELPQDKSPKEVISNILITVTLIAVTVAMTYGMIWFTGKNTMEPIEVDAYTAMKEEHITLLEMDVDEFFAHIKSGDAGVVINLPDGEGQKDNVDLQEEVEMLKKELQDVIDDATETEKELKAQLKDATSDVATDRKELKTQLEDIIATKDEVEQQLKDANSQLSNHIEEQKETIQNNNLTIERQQQTINQLKEEASTFEARERALEQELEEMRGKNDEVTNQ